MQKNWWSTILVTIFLFRSGSKRTFRQIRKKLLGFEPKSRSDKLQLLRRKSIELQRLFREILGTDG